ncbi:MAG: hypothetical protein IT174_07330 [Acidobacteria bacterium]|nr:hypothetical protein [Acidobacteriota bacterium]
MTTTILEGTWEEIAKQANRLAGKKLRVEVLEDTPKREPNRRMLEVMERVKERLKDMPETGGESGVDIIRRGRAGEMFGYEPVE